MEELIHQAAQGEVLHNDDTSMPVLALRRDASGDEDEAERTGVFTSGIVSTAQQQTIALFFTGRQHAGENLSDVLQRRSTELAPPLQMCDALSRNLPKLPQKLEVIVGHCLAHARRRFVEVTPNFPQPCQHVLEQLGITTKADPVQPRKRRPWSAHDGSRGNPPAQCPQAAAAATDSSHLRVASIRRLCPRSNSAPAGIVTHPAAPAYTLSHRPCVL